jgi:hypothetical protein
MVARVLAAIVAFGLTAWADTLSVNQLVEFLQNAAKSSPDQKIATYLAKVRLKDRLDDRTIETLLGCGIGPKTRQVLEKLKEASVGLAPPPPVVVEPPPPPEPPPSSEEQAEAIAAVREYALNYSRNLPDFICAQVTKRWIAPSSTGKYRAYAGNSDTPSWQAVDTLTIRLSYFEQKENYKLLLRNNTPMTQDYERIGGPKSFGDFGSLMREVFQPSTHARFEWDHWATLNRQHVMAFGYRVAQANSQYRIGVEELKLSIVTGYHGLVYVDPESHAVLRITVEADGIPADFPIQAAVTKLDYRPQDLSGHSFLLPTKAQVLMTGRDVLNKIDEEFRLYRKYSAESELKFDTEPMPAAPEIKAEEEGKAAAPNKK